MSEIKRQKINFNLGWKFHKGDVLNAQDPNFDDSAWRNINLPHDWSIEGEFSQEWASGTGYLPGGIGWYRKTFVLPRLNDPCNIYIYFDGVYKNSEVWINGHFLGKRPNGFIPFQYELTDFLNPGGKNTIAVKVDHSDFADSRWYTGSGINRNVYLIITDPLHIDLWGVKFTSKIISEKSAEAMVSVTIVNDRSSREEIILEVKLFDINDHVVGRAQKSIQINKGEKIKKDVSFQVKNPVLWSIDNPYLYNLKVQLINNNNEIFDSQVIPVGIRSFRFDADKGFFLNGKNIKIKGVCIHDDAGILGTAVPKEVWARRLKTLKDVGCNAIRMSHNPHAEYLYDLCDRMGFLVMDEAFDEWKIGKNKWIKGRNVGTPGKDGYNRYFNEWAEKDLKDMILRNQNHPSIIMWSIGNEIDYPNDPYTHKILDKGRNPQIFGRGYMPDHPNVKELEGIAAKLIKWVHETDKSRPVTAALACLAMSNFTKYPELLDIVGYNYQEYVYEEDHKKYPQRIIYGSENSKDFKAWQAVEENDYIAGQFLWTGVDYLGEAGRWPNHGASSGLIDLAGFPKPCYFYRQSLWSDSPMIYIGTASISQISQMKNKEDWDKIAQPTWNWREGETVVVTCFTNCEVAELFLNGKSLGKKKLSDAPQKVIQWVIRYQPGSLSAKGYNKGKEVAEYTLRTAGQPFAIEAQIDKKLFKKGEEERVSHIEISVVDKNGVPVFNANNVITVTIEGKGKMLGLENGDLNDPTDYKTNNYKTDSRKVYHGKLLAYVQPEEKGGSIKIHLTSPGLQPKTVQIISE